MAAEPADAQVAGHPMKTLILLSGGLDSAVVLALQSGPCEAIGFDYGQPNRIELDRAAQIATHYGVPFSVLSLPQMPLVNDVVFAGRNLVMAAVAVAHAQAKGFGAVAVGCNASDWERFPDCRPPFWKAVNAAAKAYGVRVASPLLHHWKGAIIELARSLGVPIELTWSCYQPKDSGPCGECLACRTRSEAGA